jgi:hydrogenase/urease accessory protein HupE
MGKRILIIGILCCLSGFWGQAHELRPALLQVKQTDSIHYSVYWKIPRLGDKVPGIFVDIPSGQLQATGQPSPTAGYIVYSYELTVPNGIRGKRIGIEGLENTLVDALVNIQFLNGEGISLMLQADRTHAMVPEQASPWHVIKTYTILGVEHILLGFDHLLFVLALVLIIGRFSKLVKTITAFTLAHSLTLALVVLGQVSLPGPPVEAVIALSIVFLALEILHLQHGRPTLTQRKPWLVAFTFGLLHGFGFAGALADIGLPHGEVPLALGFFNLGVELGQIAFVSVAWLVLQWIPWQRPIFRPLKKIPAYAIGTLAMFWTLERIIGMI